MSPSILTPTHPGDGTDHRAIPFYGANGAAAVVRDNCLHRTMQTEYDLAERPMQSTLRDEDGNVLYRATLTYDAQNRLQAFHERTGGTYHKTAFTYDKDSRVTQMDYDTDRGKRNDMALYLRPRREHTLQVVLPLHHGNAGGGV